MYEVTDKFVEAMIPILERESGMAWGSKSVGRVVRWTCKASPVLGLIREALWTDGEHHKQWYLEQIAAALSIDIEDLDEEMARCGNVERRPGIAP